MSRSDHHGCGKACWVCRPYKFESRQRPERWRTGERRRLVGGPFADNFLEFEGTVSKTRIVAIELNGQLHTDVYDPYCWEELEGGEITDPMDRVWDAPLLDAYESPPALSFNLPL